MVDSPVRNFQTVHIDRIDQDLLTFPTTPRTGCRWDKVDFSVSNEKRPLAKCRWPFPKKVLLTKLKSLEEGLVALVRLALNVIEKLTTAGNEAEESTAGGVILLIGLEVLGEVIDTLCQESDLVVS